MSLITIDDLTPFATIDNAKAEAMIEDATAQASLVAPCLTDGTELTPAQQSAAKAILRRAILRWNETGVAGVVTQQSAGPFSQTTTTTNRGGLFWPSEIAELQNVCKSASPSGDRRAFNVDQIDYRASALAGHQPWCSITWGDWCSCGANLTRNEYPLWEGGLIS